jgi:predicted ATPase
MNPRVTFTAVKFDNFKALRDYSLPLRRMNVLVGPNNSGKSTVLGAFRILAAGMRRASAKSSQAVAGPNSYQQGYPLVTEELPISLENVHTDYSDRASSVSFKLSTGPGPLLYFPVGADCVMVLPGKEVPTMRPSSFRYEYPVTVGVVPVLGPVEHEEELLKPETVARNLATHRASRNFRNYWHYNQDGFEEFRALIEQTWPGMSIQPPEVNYGKDGAILTMFCKENRIDRELHWVGFGFQVWCQLLTHILRASKDSLLIIDEPEIYLHPDLQRQLVRLLRNAGPDVILATHSTEIVNEADPSEITIVNKAWKTGRRVRDIEGIQTALDFLGSGVNVTLTQLARTRRVVFVEGEDFRLLRRFAEKLDLYELATGVDVTPVSVGGFGSIDKLVDLSWGIENTIGLPMALAAVFDRDYFCDAQIATMLGKLKQQLTAAFVHKRKELENYLLVPDALDRAVSRAAHDRARRTNSEPPKLKSSVVLLEEITSQLEEQLQSAFIGKYIEYMRSTNPKLDSSTATREALKLFNEKWKTLETRLEIVPGKEVFSKFNERIQSEVGVSISPGTVIQAMRADEVPDDLRNTLIGLEEFRKVTPETKKAVQKKDEKPVETTSEASVEVTTYFHGKRYPLKR